MKAINDTKWHQIKYPRDTPRISRKRLWIDRNEWRKDPQSTLEGGQGTIDERLSAQRTLGDLESTNYNDLPDMMERAGRIGIRKF